MTIVHVCSIFEQTVHWCLDWGVSLRPTIPPWGPRGCRRWALKCNDGGLVIDRHRLHPMQREVESPHGAPVQLQTGPSLINSFQSQSLPAVGSPQTCQTNLARPEAAVNPSRPTHGAHLVNDTDSYRAACQSPSSERRDNFLARTTTRA